jgi:hypothetical protein
MFHNVKELIKNVIFEDLCEFRGGGSTQFGRSNGAASGSIYIEEKQNRCPAKIC